MRKARGGAVWNECVEMEGGGGCESMSKASRRRSK